MGLQPSEWENMTPSQFYAYAEGYINKKQKETETINRSVYNMAALIHGTLMAKRMPAYETVFESHKKTQMSDEAMYSTCASLNAMFGGNME